MKRIAVRVALATIVLVLLSTLTAVAHDTASSVFAPAAELKWNDVPDFPGVKMAPVHGDSNKGAAHFFFKLPAGFASPLHFHNSDHWVAVVSGTVILALEGGAEQKLAAGSAFGFTGKKKHTTKCVAGADCVLFIDSRGAWDVIPAEKK